MHRLVLPFVLVVTACGTPGPAGPGGKQQPLTAKDIVQRSSPAIVRIETGDALGTGFIIDGTGLVATNLHVVRGKKEIKVKLYGGDVYPVMQIAGVDRPRDLALLKIAPSKTLPTLRLGDSDKMSAGDEVIAIGNPLGVFDYSVSSGLVSQVRPLCTPEAVALHNKLIKRFEELVQKDKRTDAEEEELAQLGCIEELKFFQISAPISQGSSGGPLFNQSGEVVGVTTAIITAGQNINLAIPTNYLKSMPQQKLSMDDFASTFKGEETGGSGGPAIVRDIPNHPITVFDGCNGDQIADLVQSIWSAIESGAPLYNSGNSEACFRIYEGTATKFERDGACKGIRTAFGDGLLKANAKKDFKEKAWAMRDTFDGLLKAAEKWVAAGNTLPGQKTPKTPTPPKPPGR
jgi:serine protease Do